MVNLTQRDVSYEALEKTKLIREKDTRRAKRIFENLATIISAALVVLSIIMYSYNVGYCRIFNIPPNSIPVNIKNFLPFVINSVNIVLYIFYYAAYIKTDKVLEKAKINPMRVFFGAFIVFYFLTNNNINNLMGNIWTLIVSVLLPVIIELFFLFLNKPKVNKTVTEKEHKSLLEDYVLNIIMYNSYIKYGAFVLIIIVPIASAFGGIKAKAENKYTICSGDNTSYAVICEYDDKVLVEQALISDNKMIIDADSYKYISKENVVFTYQKFDKVTIKNN